MRIDNSIQRRVFASFGTFTLLLSLVYTGICVLVAYVIEDRVLGNLLVDEANYIEQRFQTSGEIARPRLPYVTLYSDSNPPPADIRAALPDGTSRAEWFADGERHFHLRRLQLENGPPAILAAEVSGLLTVSRQSGGLLWLIFLALLATSVLALWMAYRVSSQTIRPVISLAEEVKSQQDSEGPISLAASAAKDEIGFLAGTLEQAINKLKLALQRESEFTRDVSHELRTGITIVKNTLSLSADRDQSQQETGELRAALEGMENTVSALLALARAESVEQTPLDLRQLLEDCILARHRRITERNFQIDLELPGNYRVLGNSNLATLLIDNLVDNALQHASQPQLRIYASGKALIFENATGEYIDTNTALLPGGKGRLSRGLGQGLFLADRLLTALGWGCAVNCNDELFEIAVYPKHIEA